MIFVNTVKYCTTLEIQLPPYFLDFTIFHNVSYVSQCGALYCTAPVCSCLLMGEALARLHRLEVLDSDSDPALLLLTYLPRPHRGRAHTAWTEAPGPQP